nr:hypothetical protein Q903MT_gene2520 [Picea sitchensis]
MKVILYIHINTKLPFSFVESLYIHGIWMEWRHSFIEKIYFIHLSRRSTSFIYREDLLERKVFLFRPKAIIMVRGAGKIISILARGFNDK